MCVLFTNAVLSFPIPNSNKIISEKLEVCVCVRGKQVSFFHSYSERVMLPAGSWWCYNTVLLSPPPPRPPINIMQLVRDEAQYTDGFYLPKLPNCLFKGVNDK